MSVLKSLIKRNTKLFFKDKGMFFTALITPLILLVLYGTFLGNIYEDTYVSFFKDLGLLCDESLTDGFVAGQLVSSLLAVTCVTVSFCANFLSVQDKTTGVRQDLTVSPVKSSSLALGYYMATIITTLIIVFVTLIISLLYVNYMGWYMSVSDVALLVLDVVLLSLFGTALSSVINFFLTTQGQISAVGTIISAGYGFICGAYMPISSFSDGLQRVLSFFPGTYGTSLVRNHSMRGVFAEMEANNIPKEALEAIRDSVDCNLYFGGEKVGIGMMYLVLVATIIALVAVYVLLNKKKAN